MPNRPFHTATSTPAGIAYSWELSAGQPDHARILEAIGGGFGGYAGGRAPDALDPPTCPTHRGRAHSFAVAVTLVAACQTMVPIWQQKCREQADQFAARRAQCVAGSGEALLLGIAEAFWRMLAGCLAGFPAGYLTHLGFDALTPACINII